MYVPVCVTIRMVTIGKLIVIVTARARSAHRAPRDKSVRCPRVYRAVSRIRSPATLIIRRRYITIMTHFYGPNRCRIVRAPRPTRPLPSSLALRPSDPNLPPPNAGAFASTQLPPRRLLTGALSLSAYAGGVDSPLAPRPRVGTHPAHRLRHPAHPFTPFMPLVPIADAH